MSSDRSIELPTLVFENNIRPFEYYWAGKVRSGMMLNGRIYAMYKCLSETERAIAYEQGCKLAEKCEVTITVSQGPQPQYRLWIAVSSDTDRVLLEQTVQSGSGNNGCDTGALSLKRR